MRSAGISDGMDDTVAGTPPREPGAVPSSQPSSPLGDMQQIISRADPFIQAISQRDEPMPTA